MAKNDELPFGCAAVFFLVVVLIKLALLAAFVYGVIWTYGKVA